MRMAALTLIGALGFAASVVSTNAAPVMPTPATLQASNIVQAAGGCGRGFHPNRWGRCVPNRYGYYGPRPHWRGYYGQGYGPWGGPCDHVANELNRGELGRMYGY
jgi:hypothetical protein